MDAYDKNRNHLPSTKLGKQIIEDVCYTKVQLYSEGYRIEKIVTIEDFSIYLDHKINERSLKSIYLTRIRN
ncbi:hypothetical protein SAMN04488490_0908 [Marinobacter sp. LV10R510-11A]|nr:hypothetical protein SAMN04488490_0908 [Marinobacter sp. LV10R510-11A]